MFFSRLFAQHAPNSQSVRSKKQSMKLFLKPTFEAEKRSWSASSKALHWSSIQREAKLTATEKLLLQEKGFTMEQINHFSHRLFVTYCLEAATKNPSPRDEIFKSLLTLPPAETDLPEPEVFLKKSR